MEHNNKMWMWIPAQFEKAGGGKDEDKPLIVKGVASTSDLDEEGEILLPEGFDLSYFNQKGLINWNHGANKDPMLVIGEPTKSVIKGNKMLVEGELYKDSQLARGVYELGLLLQKSSKTRRLGFSIEGKATERDPLNPKKITKAKITGLAITHQPINKGTECEVLKGFGDFPYQEVDDEEIDIMEKNGINPEVLKGEKENRCWEGYEPVPGKKPYEEGSCKKKSVEDDDDEDQEKSLETSSDSGQAIMPESVEGSPKNTTDKEEENLLFNKGEVFLQIFDRHSGISSTQADELYQLINRIQTMSKQDQPMGVSQDAINKAFEILEIAANETGSNSDDGLEKGGSGCTYKKEKGGYYRKMKGGEYVDDKKYMKKGDDYVPMSDEEDDDDDEGGDDKEKGKKMKKSVSYDGLRDDLSKAFQDLGVEVKQNHQSQENGFKAIGTILKSFDEKLEQIKEEFQDFSSSQDNYRKSFNRQPQAINKGSFIPQNNDQEPELISKAHHRSVILQKLDAAAFKNEQIDPEMSKALTTFESSGILTPAAIEYFRKQNVQVVD